MADSQKLTALKKAYAEIILNTAKEAAARIMVSERKALRYQQELFAAKDEALRMLLRLKQMLDAKVNDAEMMSLNQQKRIEELEAQLGEAEDIVRDLRAELREAQDELEKLSQDSVHYSDEKRLKDDVAASVERSQENTINEFWSVRSLPDAQTNLVTVSDIKSSVLSRTNAGNKCSCKDNCYVCNPDFASIVMRRKEPDLYRNGCTHRIRALERCLLNENLSLSRQVDDAKNENTGEGEEGKGMPSKLSTRADMCRLEGKTDELKVMNNITQVLPLSFFHMKRKRAARYKKNKASSSMNVLDQVVAMCQEPDLLCLESFSHDAESNGQFGEDSRIIKHDTQKGPHSPNTSSPLDAAKVIAESGYEDQKDDVQFGKACDFNDNKNNDKSLVDKKQLIRQESGSAEISGDPSCKTDLETVDGSAVNLDVKSSEITERSSPQLSNNKFLMYTFKRKRKKDSLSSPDRDCSHDDDILHKNKKIKENQNGSLDSEKSTLTSEESRDSRRLVQVARQLISLSEKKLR
ncbi:hypothetical protein ES319_D03G107800v1 [Gossypium barbadense]|uniref:Uncharacterized protein n=2 Tax=Gossypium TaxID=3633 RepID=A0A5J5S453_GOSBA|nr:hypothetical protein ES319_D03G107800v1 [Gossypium barbadense]TYG76476.1 hypothetical protein ES288_D03G117100v1 [Gossypium darwinii]